jgi:hypothetical protein
LRRRLAAAATSAEVTSKAKWAAVCRSMGSEALLAVAKVDTTECSTG